MMMQDIVMPDPPAPQEGYVNEPNMAEGIAVEDPQETDNTL